MEPAEIQIGQSFYYKRTGERMKVVGKCSVKDAGDANWQPGIAYISLDNSENLPYVRATSDFLDKHTLIGEPDDDSDGQDFSGGETHWVQPGKN